MNCDIATLKELYTSVVGFLGAHDEGIVGVGYGEIMGATPIRCGLGIFLASPHFSSDIDFKGRVRCFLHRASTFGKYDINMSELFTKSCP